jgi:ABC-type transport system involved in Fe-S cluster assembly fused permease/ATPase subunit
VVNGEMTVGQWVMIQTYLLQLAQPLAWLGTAWRVIQQVPIHFVAHILFVTYFSHPYLVSCVVIHSFS